MSFSQNFNLNHTVFWQIVSWLSLTAVWWCQKNPKCLLWLRLMQNNQYYWLISSPCSTSISLPSCQFQLQLIAKNQYTTQTQNRALTLQKPPLSVDLIKSSIEFSWAIHRKMWFDDCDTTIIDQPLTAFHVPLWLPRNIHRRGGECLKFPMFHTLFKSSI